MGQLALCLGDSLIGLDTADRIGHGCRGDVSFDLLRQQPAQLLVFFSQLGVFLSKLRIFFAQLADAVANLRLFAARLRVGGGGFGRFRIVQCKRRDEQSSEQSNHRESERSQKNFESLPVHKPAQLTRIRLVFSFSSVKRQRQGVRTVKAREVTRPAGFSSTDPVPVGVSRFGCC